MLRVYCPKLGRGKLFIFVTEPFNLIVCSTFVSSKLIVKTMIVRVAERIFLTNVVINGKFGSLKNLIIARERRPALAQEQVVDILLFI